MHILIFAISGLCAIIGIGTTAYVIRSNIANGKRTAFGKQLDTLADPINEDSTEELREQLAANTPTPVRSLRKKKQDLPLDFFSNQKLQQSRHNRKRKIKPLQRKILYAGWRISPLAYNTIKYGLALLLFIPAYLYTSVFVQILVLFLTPRLVDVLLDRAIKVRLEEFDKDYPVLLLQLVSFLRSGMIAMTAFREAAKSLDNSSLVKREVGILNERLKLGLSEEQAINAFGEDIAHPEIELFVQSFLLHSRVGGNLSSTLERLAIQVRKRQQFRSEAHSAIASERISIYAIAAIMIALLIYIHVSSPVLISACFNNPTGQLIFQGGVCLIVLGFYWSSRITNIDM